MKKQHALQGTLQEAAKELSCVRWYYVWALHVLFCL
jgi:hypothetical protein